MLLAQTTALVCRRPDTNHDGFTLSAHGTRTLRGGDDDDDDDDDTPQLWHILEPHGDDASTVSGASSTSTAALRCLAVSRCCGRDSTDSFHYFRAEIKKNLGSPETKSCSSWLAPHVLPLLEFKHGQGFPGGS